MLHHRHQRHNHQHHRLTNKSGGLGGGQVFPAAAPPLPKLFLSSDSETETSERPNPNNGGGGSLWDHAELAGGGGTSRMAFPPQTASRPAPGRAADPTAPHKNGVRSSSGRLAAPKPSPSRPSLEARTVALKLTVPANTPVPPLAGPTILSAASVSRPMAVPGKMLLLPPQRKIVQQPPPPSPLPGRPLSPVVIFNNNNSKRHRSLVQPTITRTNTDDDSAPPGGARGTASLRACAYCSKSFTVVVVASNLCVSDYLDHPAVN